MAQDDLVHVFFYHKPRLLSASLFTPTTLIFVKFIEYAIIFFYSETFRCTALSAWNAYTCSYYKSPSQPLIFQVSALISLLRKGILVPWN